MIFQRFPQFLDEDTLSILNNTLIDQPRWTFRGNFWRYYFVNDLDLYDEQNEDTWYGNQLDRLLSELNPAWRNVFQRVIDIGGTEFIMQRYALTGLTQNQLPDLHVDTSVNLPGQFRTFLIYLNSEWKYEWGGATELQTDDHTIFEYPTPGKLVAFDSQTLHRACAPTVPNVLRMTLAINGRVRSTS